MHLTDKVVVVTGAAGGIGAALARQFAREGARKVICADIDAAGCKQVALECAGVSIPTDVAREADIRRLIETTESEYGPIDLFCSNAGVGVGGGAEAPDEAWTRIWNINLMSHVWVARALVPRMASRGGGHLMITASAAGLLSQIGSAPYAVTKHAVVGLAEWLAITHGDSGVKVHALCPQAVRTAMTASNPDGVASRDGMIEPEAVAEACVRGLEAEQFLILPHPEVLGYMRRKTEDYDRWIGGMRKLNRAYRG